MLHSKTFLPLLFDFLKLRRTAYPWTYISRAGSKILVEDWWDVTTIWSIYAASEYEVRPSDKTILDFGANIGVFAIFAAERSRQAEIHSYEPFPSTFHRLQQTISNNQLHDRVETYASGIGPTDRTATMAVDNNASVCRTVDFENDIEAEGFNVPIISMQNAVDQFNAEQIDLLKMDIEGAETEVLMKCPSETLRRIGRLCIEIHKHDDIGPITKRLNSEGFQVTRRKGHGMEQTLTFDNSKHR